MLIETGTILKNIDLLKANRLVEGAAYRDVASITAQTKRHETAREARVKIIIANGYANGTISGNNAAERKASESKAISENTILFAMDEQFNEFVKTLPEKTETAELAKVERKYCEDLHSAYLTILRASEYEND